MISKRNMGGIGLILLYLSLFYLPYLFRHTTPLFPAFQDETDVFLVHLFVKTSLEHGFFPLWIPNWYCGMPFLAYSHSRVLYPLSILYTLFDFNQAVWIHQWLHVSLYSLGLFLLCRRVGASLSAALLAVLVVGTLYLIFALGNYLPALSTGAWIPWLFLVTMNLVRERRFVSFLGFILINWLMFLGGQLALLGITYEVIGVALLAWGIASWRRPAWVLAGGAVLGCAFTAGYLIAQVQALPTMELTYSSARQLGFTYQRFMLFAALGAGWEGLLRFLPSAAVAVCLAAAVAGARRSGVLGLFTLALGFCLAVNLNLFGINWIIYQVPILRSFGGQSLIELSSEVLLGVMIALGADRLRAAPSSRRWPLAFAAASLITAAVVWGMVSPHPDSVLAPYEPNQKATGLLLLQALQVGLAFQAAIAILLLVSTWITRQARRLWFPALILTVLAVYAVPVFYCLPRRSGDVFGFPPELGRFLQSHPGLYRTQFIYDINHWENIQIPLQSGVIYGTRSADAFNNLPLLRYTQFLKALIPRLYLLGDGQMSTNLESSKVFKDGSFLNERTLRFVNFMGIRYLVTELKNIKFASPFFLAYPDSPLLAATRGATSERRTGPQGLEDVIHFEGNLAGKIYAQPGDRLQLEFEAPTPGRWWSVQTEAEAKPQRALEFARWTAARRSEPIAVDLGRRGGATLTLRFLGLDPGGRPAAGVLVNPTISNPAKYFQRLPLPAEFNLFENPGALPPAFFVERVRAVKKEEVLTRILDPSFDPGREALVEDPRLSAFGPGPLQPGEGVQIIRYTPEAVALAATAGADRLLVMSDTYFPGWRLWVDDREARIWPVNYAFRGVLLERGQHRLILRYQPLSFHLALWITLSSLACLLAAAFLLAARRAE